jgi:L-fuconolactonase
MNLPTVCKVRVLRRLSHEPVKDGDSCRVNMDDDLGPLARVFDACGFERCLWGTDWTRAFAVVNYEQAVEPFRRNRPPERE